MDKLKKALEKAKGNNTEIELDTKIPKVSYIPKRKEIFPIYKQTKVVPIDKDHLRKNKIFSFFHEDSMAEQLKIMRTRILNQMEELNGNTLLITSAIPGEGKTLTSINLAISMAQEFDRTVLLVDANLKNPAIHNFLGLKVDKGLVNVLLKEVDIPEVLINPSIPRFVVLPAGKTFHGSAELLGSPYAETLFYEMKTRYAERFIIFDSSSLLTSADPLILAKYADAALMIVEAEKTPSENVEEAFKLLKSETSILGVVLNKVKM